MGDVEPADAFHRVKTAFEDVAPRETPARFTFTEPAPSGERRQRVDDAHAAMPALHVNFKVAERRHPDVFALSVVERILGAGESGRLWRRLVKDDSLALSLSVSLDERRGPSLFRVFSLARPGVTLERLEAEILGDLERFAADGPTPPEMERSRRLLLSSAVRATQTTQATRRAHAASLDSPGVTVTTDLLEATSSRAAASRTVEASSARTASTSWRKRPGSPS